MASSGVAAARVAMDSLVRTEQQSGVPSVRLYTGLLQACARDKALAEAKLVQARIAKAGLDSNEFLRELVVDTLVKCGSLDDALPVFHGLEHRTAFSWTAIISAYCQKGQESVAFRLYWRMQQEHVRPNKYTLLCLLKACGSVEEGRRIQAEVVRHGLESDLFLSTALLNMYAKCGSVVDARHVFDALPRRDVVSWNAMIGGYAEQEQGEKALELYREMRDSDVSPNDRTFVSALKAVGCVAGREQQGRRLSTTTVGGGAPPPLSLDLFMHMGRAIHAEAALRGYSDDVFVASSLISMYSKCGSLDDARRAFDYLGECNVVSCNAMLTGYAEQEQGAEDAVQLYYRMLEEGVRPTDRTFVAVLKACGTMAAREEGKKIVVAGQQQQQQHTLIRLNMLQVGKSIHVELTQRGYASDPFVGNTLVCLYARCGSILDAQHAFDSLPERNVVSWNSMIAAYADQGHGEAALLLYNEMQEEGVRPDERTFVSLMKACGSIILAASDSKNVHDVDHGGGLTMTEVLQKVKILHSEVALRGFDRDVFVGSCLVSLYVTCGQLEDAQHVFDALPRPDVVAWSAIIAGYAHQEQGDEAWELYNQMLAEGIQSDSVVFLCILAACSNAGALGLCKQLHQHIIDSGHDSNPKVVTALIDAYAKCGNMVDAQNVFDSLPQHDAWAWTALVTGYARHGDWERSVECFELMCGAGMNPDAVTFISLLSACSHAGLVDRGLHYFQSMSTIHGVCPTGDHFACMVDLLGRAGLFDEVERLLDQMPVQPDFALWSSLLGACRKHGNTVLGRRAFDHLVEVEPEQASAYVLMATIYVQAGMVECAEEVENLRRQAGAWRAVGQTWVQHEQEVTAFAVGDRKHWQSGQLYKFLKELDLRLPSQGKGRVVKDPVGIVDEGS